jgi:hypothetical protein
MARVVRLERDSADLKRTMVLIADSLAELSERVDSLGERLEGRLDRLIAVTTQERTYSVERLANIERRLARLEKRSRS